MDRQKKIKRCLVSFCDSWIKQKIMCCIEQPEATLLQQTEELLYHLLKKQTDGSQSSLCYISLFHFRSSLWTGTYRYQICLSDETLYLNAPLASKDWTPEHLYKDVSSLYTAVEKALRNYFVRLKPHEIEYAMKVILEEYQKLAEVYWYEAAKQLVTGDFFNSVKKHRHWKILSGTYMDNLNVILQALDER